MDIIEVDPKLFVTCRLCLEDLGQFQIVPSVGQQIKYCFDIEVEPFDGLPQLICLKCKEILSKYHSLKTTFCDKQTQLKNRVSKKEEISISQHNTVSSSQQNELNSSDTKAETTKNKPKNKRVIESSSDEAETEKISKTKTKKRKILTRNKVCEWEKGYKKEIVCKICNSHWLKKTSFRNHIRTHDAIIYKYKNVFNKPCSVILEKIDGKPNVIGESNLVMLNTNKIIKHGDMRFHTVYSSEAIPIDENVTEKQIESAPSNETNISQQHSEDDFDDEIVAKRKTRSLRLLSRSSNDTVVLENYDKNASSDNDDNSRTASPCSDERPVAGNDVCINIDDSESDSNSGNFDSGQRVKQPIEAKFGDYKIIQGIISMCVNAYQKKPEVGDIETYINVMQIKKPDKPQVNNESQLKHKLLSIGRKIINKQGFNCTGLLRFMEHKNLEILWITKPLPFKTNRDTNYIRILTKLRENDTPDDCGWKYISENTVLDDNVPSPNILNDLFSSVPDGKNSYQDANTSEKSELNEPISVDDDSQNVLNKQSELETLPAVLYFNNNNNANSLPKKLLNSNPVANPKLLPKKSGQTNERASKSLGAVQNVCPSDSEDVNFCMPIITSTTSLATSTTEERKEDKSLSSGVGPNLNTPAPRIKVKPASELMSERMLNSIRKESTASSSITNILSSPSVWPHQQPINVILPNMPQPVMASQPVQLVQVPGVTLPPPCQEIAPNQTSNTQRDQVILDSIEFPNTKTDSPFKYFKDVLQMHNLVLLHPCDKLTPNTIE